MSVCLLIWSGEVRFARCLSAVSDEIVLFCDKMTGGRVCVNISLCACQNISFCLFGGKCNASPAVEPTRECRTNTFFFYCSACAFVKDVLGSEERRINEPS